MRIANKTIHRFMLAALDTRFISNTTRVSDKTARDIGPYITPVRKQRQTNHSLIHTVNTTENTRKLEINK